MVRYKTSTISGDVKRTHRVRPISKQFVCYWQPPQHSLTYCRAVGDANVKERREQGGGAIAYANLRIRGRSERHYSLFTRTMLIEAGFSASTVGASPTLRIIYYSNCGPESRRSGLRMSSSSGDRVSAVLYQVDPDNPSRNSLVTTRALGPCHCSLDPEVESTLAA